LRGGDKSKKGKETISLRVRKDFEKRSEVWKDYFLLKTFYKRMNCIGGEK